MLRPRANIRKMKTSNPVDDDNNNNEYNSYRRCDIRCYSNEFVLISIFRSFVVHFGIKHLVHCDAFFFSGGGFLIFQIYLLYVAHRKACIRYSLSSSLSLSTISSQIMKYIEKDLF